MANNTPNVAFVRVELRYLLKLYTIIRDCLLGEHRIKYRKDKYLPRPNADDISDANIARYDSYLERALFYGVTKRTLGGLVGLIFLRDPIVEIPAVLDPIKTDANGAGGSLIQLAKSACALVLSYARAGVFVDFPKMDTPATRAQLQSGEIRPVIKLYEPWNIINWRTIKRGAREILSLVVLHELFITSDDGFEIKYGHQWRVLRLDADGKYVMYIYQSTEAVINENTDPIDYIRNRASTGPIGNPEIIEPLDDKGERLDEIPFSFIGAENNEPRPNEPVLYDMAILNIGHYRNSADHEDIAYMVGQPTPYFAGLTESWVRDVLGGQVQLGSRAAVPLPQGGSAGLLQIDEHTMPFEAMKHKERQMVAIGAKLVEEKQVQRTATEADLENTSETSVLSASADNVSAAFTFALKFAARFVGITVVDKPDDAQNVKGDVIKFELNTEFDLVHMTPEERTQLIAEWNAGAVAFPEMRANLRRAGIASLDDAAATKEIDSEQEKRNQREITKAKALQPVRPPVAQ